jgi:hypothetical protein
LNKKGLIRIVGLFVLLVGLPFLFFILFEVGKVQQEDLVTISEVVESAEEVQVRSRKRRQTVLNIHLKDHPFRIRLDQTGYRLISRSSLEPGDSIRVDVRSRKLKAVQKDPAGKVLVGYALQTNNGVGFTYEKYYRTKDRQGARLVWIGVFVWIFLVAKDLAKRWR